MSIQALTPVLSLVLTGAKAVVRWYQARRDFAALCGMDDRALADIGLKRSDLRNATAAPLYQDPTRTLVETVNARKTRVLATDLPYVSSPASAPGIGENRVPVPAFRAP